MWEGMESSCVILHVMLMYIFFPDINVVYAFENSFKLWL